MDDLHSSLSRLQEEALAESLSKFPAVILHGARQTGKTTLAKMPSIGGNRTYITLDELGIRETARSDPGALLAGIGKLTIDEVQREPEILLSIKMDIDRDRKAGRFLLTGSANMLLMKKVSESLAGRAIYFNLPPLLWPEIEQVKFGSTLDLLCASKSVDEFLSSHAGGARKARRPLVTAVFRGGYPVPSLSGDVLFASQWFESYVQTYLERDLRDFTATDNLIEFRRMMRICAVRNGGLVNVASLASDAGISQTTARRYLGILQVSFQVMAVPAFARSRGKRLVKSPKMYWTDTGLAAHLAGFAGEDELHEAREWGCWLENYVAIHLGAYASLRRPGAGLCHWRTSGGHEVDFVLELGRKLIPIEVKSTASPMRRDIAGLETFLDEYWDAPFGVIACRCDTPRAVTSRIVAVPMEELLLG